MLKVTPWDVIVVTIVITIFIIIRVGDHRLASMVGQTYESCSTRQSGSMIQRVSTAAPHPPQRPCFRQVGNVTELWRWTKGLSVEVLRAP